MLLLRHIPIPGKDVYSSVIHPHQQWGCASPGMHTLTVNAHSLYKVSMQMRSAADIDKYTRWLSSFFLVSICTPSEAHLPFLAMVFIPVWFILTRNGHPHRQWGYASPWMHTLTVNAHSLYRVSMQMRSSADINKYTRWLSSILGFHVNTPGRIYLKFDIFELMFMRFFLYIIHNSHLVYNFYEQAI